MPIYNGARYLREAIESLFAQTLTDWEFIVVDDGSTDETPEILATYKDARVRVFHQANGGEARARNTGLDQVTGEYVAFLDADDQYLPNALQDYVTYLDEHLEFDVIFSDGYICDSDNNRLSRLTDHRPGIYTGNIIEELILNPAVITVPVCTAFRYEVVVKYQARFDPAVGYGTDWDFWTQLALKVKFGYLDQKTCLYRIHGNNMTSTATTTKRKSDQLKGRLKVFSTDWFETLSLRTRESFLYNLVINLLSDCPEKQLEFLSTDQAKKIHPITRAKLYRLAGVEILQGQRNPDLAQVFLLKSLELYSSDLKTRILLQITRLPGPIALYIINLWRTFFQMLIWLKSRGKHHPKPLPQQYGPVAANK